MTRRTDHQEEFRKIQMCKMIDFVIASLNISLVKFTEMLSVEGVEINSTSLSRIKNIAKGLKSGHISFEKIKEIYDGSYRLYNKETGESLDIVFLQFSRKIPNTNIVSSIDLSYESNIDLLEAGASPNLKALNLSNSNFSELGYIEEYINLEKLNLSQTNVENIERLKSLIYITSLNLSNLRITDISCLSYLKDLQYLDISFTQVSDLRPISNLKNIKRIDLRGSMVRDLSPLLPMIKKGINVVWKEQGSLGNNEICLFNNPLVNPPIEIVRAGSKAILSFFNEIDFSDSYYIYEAKLIIIGEAGAGKTSLALKLINPHQLLNTTTTEGIEIHNLEFDCGKETPFRINLWDFGGQEIYHMTHQFFLTKRSLYVLVTDGRNENTDFNYWLRTVETYSDNSPLIILENIKEGRKQEIDQRGLAGRFVNLINPIYYVDLKNDNKELKRITEEIHNQIQKLDHIGSELPRSWVVIRNNLETRKKEDPYISLRDFYKICKKGGIYERKRAKLLSQYLHDLGSILHFQDDIILQTTLFLRNSWVTTGVYRLLDSTEIKQKNGHFTLSDIDKIWNDEDYEGMQGHLIALMKKFELCYEVKDSLNPKMFIAPQLLQIEQPSYEWSNKNNLELRYEYEFMPKGILGRFIVRKHRLIEDIKSKAWRSGVVLKKGYTKAEVTETYGKSLIRVRVEGEDPRELMTIIREEFDAIHASFPKLKVDSMIPCICEECMERVARGEEPHFYKYDDLKRRQRKGKKTVECALSYDEVSVDALLDAIFTNEPTENSIKVLLKEGKMEEALKMCEDLVQDKEQESWIINYHSRHRRLTDHSMRNTLSRKEREKEENKLTQSILEFLEHRNRR